MIQIKAFLYVRTSVSGGDWPAYALKQSNQSSLDALEMKAKILPWPVVGLPFYE